jgi:Trypsin-like peptidase domain
MTRGSVRTAAGIAAVVAVAGAAGASPPVRAAASPTRAATADFRGAVEIFECSGALVRWANSRPDDPAMMLTNGHCRRVLDKGSASASFTRQVIVNRRDDRQVTLLARDGTDAGVVRTKRLLYSTSFKTDVGLYTLRRSFASIRRRFDVRALVMADAGPRPRQHVQVPSGFARTIYSCDLNGTAYRLFNDDFEWHHSIRFARSTTCRTIHGTSGSPLLDPTTRQVVGVNNAINFDAGRTGCHIALCELTKDGRRSLHKHRRYAQQTWWLTTCEGTGRGIDLDQSGCRLPKPLRSVTSRRSTGSSPTSDPTRRRSPLAPGSDSSYR